MKGNALVLQGEQAKGDKCVRIILGKEKSDEELKSHLRNNLAVNWWKNSDDGQSTTIEYNNFTVINSNPWNSVAVKHKQEIPNN